MRLAVAFLLCIVPFLVSADQDWEAFKIKYNKVYRSIEEPLRKGIWEEKMRQINKHNEEAAQGLHTYTLGENQFSDLTWDEFTEQYLSKVANGEIKNVNYHVPTGRALSDTVDLRTRGLITPVKNQGSCGSCWAFASVAALEGAWANEGNGLLDLSEQQLVDCATGSYGNKGCSGGWMNPTFEYIRDIGGIQEQTTYPYTGKDESCKHDSKQFVANIGKKAYSQIPVRDYNSMREALDNGYPVVIAVYVESSFQSYKNGIYTRAASLFESIFNLNHAITLVGYNYTPGQTPYFIAKNSWDTTWGDQGYIQLKGEQDTAGFGAKASYPLVK